MSDPTFIKVNDNRIVATRNQFVNYGFPHFILGISLRPGYGNNAWYEYRAKKTRVVIDH